MRFTRRIIPLFALLAVLGVLGWWWWQNIGNANPSGGVIRRWFTDPSARPSLITQTACGPAPFILPTSGFIGLLYADPSGPYNIINRHSGIDIFGDGQPGEIPVFAAYEGYLSRLDDWLATVIIQHQDPLEPDRIIWTYYTHMASADGQISFIAPDFPPGTYGAFVEQGTLLGYQGDYGGNRVVGLHLHFSIVTSETDGSFKNEALLENTLDPSPYLGLQVNLLNGATHPVQCLNDASG